MRLRIAFVATALFVTGLYTAAFWTIYAQAPETKSVIIKGETLPYRAWKCGTVEGMRAAVKSMSTAASHDFSLDSADAVWKELNCDAVWTVVRSEMVRGAR